jgi:hypothetical protein
VKNWWSKFAFSNSTCTATPRSNPGEKRQLNVVVSYDVVEEGEGGAGVDPEDRKFFREFVVQ